MRRDVGNVLTCISTSNIFPTMPSPKIFQQKYILEGKDLYPQGDNLHYPPTSQAITVYFVIGCYPSEPASCWISRCNLPYPCFWYLGSILTIGGFGTTCILRSYPQLAMCQSGGSSKWSCFGSCTGSVEGPIDKPTRMVISRSASASGPVS